RAGNTFAGISGDSFTVVSDVAPILVWSNPNNDDADFRVDENLRLSFDEFVAAGSGNILISNGTDTRAIAIDDASQVTFEEFSVPNMFGPPISEGTVIINPAEDLVSGSTYTVEIAPGVITDTDGNPYAGFSDASFTTIDALPIIATGTSVPGLTLG
nr:Ig-like domain-containing protein [Betaproteobacteria bacterium]